MSLRPQHRLSGHDGGSPRHSHCNASLPEYGDDPNVGNPKSAVRGETWRTGEEQLEKVVLVEVLPAGQTVVVTPMNISRSVADELLAGDPAGVFELLNQSPDSNVVVDCSNNPACCSALVGFFVRLWKRTQAHDRQIAFCNVSTELSQEFETLNLNRLWPQLPSRLDAIEHVKR